MINFILLNIRKNESNSSSDWFCDILFDNFVLLLCSFFDGRFVSFGFNSVTLVFHGFFSKFSVIDNRVNISFGIFIVEILAVFSKRNANISLLTVNEETMISELLKFKLFGELIVKFNFILFNESNTDVVSLELISVFINELEVSSIESLWDDLSSFDIKKGKHCDAQNGFHFFLLINLIINYLTKL